MDRWRDTAGAIEGGSRLRWWNRREEAVGRVAPFLGQGNRLRHEGGLLVSWSEERNAVAALDTIYRATSDASSYFIDLEFLFVQVSCWQEIQVDTNRKVSLDWTRLLFTPCFHTYILRKCNIIGLYENTRRIYIYIQFFKM